VDLNRSLQKPWKYAQLGLLVFPLLPSVGALGLLVAITLTTRQQYDNIIRRRLNWVLAILASWLVLTSCFAFRPVDAFLGLFNFLPFCGLFVALSALIQTPAQLRRLSQILVFTSVPVVIIGLGQMFCGWATPAAWKDVLVGLGCAIAPGGNPLGRMSSVFAYTNLLAGYLVIVFILSLGLWLETFHKSDTSQETKRKLPTTNYQLPITNYKATRLFLTVAVVGNFVALILTNSRNAWTIAACAGIAFAIYQRWYWLVALVSAIASSVLLAAFGPAPARRSLRQIVPDYFWQRLTDQLYPNRPSVSLRTTQWQFAWGLTQQRPWTGWGLRNFQPLYEMQMQAWFGHPHNLFLMLTAEIGIPATLVFCSWLLWIFYQGIKLLINWSSHTTKTVKSKQYIGERLIFFSYLVAFFACILFNTVDVTIFDLRLNTLVWIVFSATAGVVYHQQELIIFSGNNVANIKSG
jgi:O-antigen ligase